MDGCVPRSGCVLRWVGHGEWGVAEAGGCGGGCTMRAGAMGRAVEVWVCYKKWGSEGWVGCGVRVRGMGVERRAATFQVQSTPPSKPEQACEEPQPGRRAEELGRPSTGCREGIVATAVAVSGLGTSRAQQWSWDGLADAEAFCSAHASSRRLSELNMVLGGSH